MVSNTHTKPVGEGLFEVDVFKTPQMKIVGNWKFIGKQNENGFDANNVVNIKSEVIIIHTIELNVN